MTAAIAVPTPALLRVARHLDSLAGELAERSRAMGLAYSKAASLVRDGLPTVLPKDGLAECRVLEGQIEVLLPVFKDLFFAEAGQHYRNRQAPAPMPSFDADLPPTHPTNQAAAAARGLRYVPEREVYVDADGLPCLDQFGQVLG